MPTATASAPVGERDELAALLADPTLAAPAEGVRIAIGPTRGAPFLVPEPGSLLLDHAALGTSAVRVHLRHGLELAWLLGAGLPGPLAGVLAAHTAALFLALDPPETRGSLEADECLRGLCPDPGRLAKVWADVCAHQIPPHGVIEPRMAALAAELWPLAAPVEYLLTTGGDARLRLDPQTGLNRYGCAPRPREAVSFGSCTASSVSERGFAAAEDCRRRLLRRAFAIGLNAALAEAAAAIRSDILGYYGTADLAEAIVAPSGTDATLLLSGLLATADKVGARRLTSILVGPTETGTGIPAAARGRHFAECTARGVLVEAGAAVAGFPPDMRLATIPLRRRDGTPLGSAATSRGFAVAASGAAAAGRVVLHMVAGSKTGLSAPSLATAERLARTYSESLEVVVDACQARLDPARVRDCLARGWPVLLTGSKFFGGPPFSGVILFPRERLRRRLETGAPPGGLADYVGGDAAALGGLGGNPGLALRWAAALAEMRAFAAVPVAEAATLLRRLGVGLEGLLEGDRHLHLVPPARGQGAAWSDQPTIFTVMARDPADPARWLAPAALGEIYALMNRGRQAFHIGQPVLLGHSPAGPIGGLRIAFGARQVQVLAQSAQPESVYAATMHDLRACLAKLKLLVETHA